MELTMSLKEVDRVCVLKKVLDGQISLARAAEELSLSYSQIKRLRKRFLQQGPQGLISRRRGQPGPNRLDEAIKAKALELIKRHYPDYGPTLVSEKLEAKHGLKLSKETCRKLMIHEGLWKAKQRKNKRIFCRRPRRSCKGELCQIDGSHHAWFESRAMSCCLLVAIDDASSECMALRFCEAETSQDYLDLLEVYLSKHGRPNAFYSDKFGVFKVNHKACEARITRFHEVLKRLDIELICANSPQAKGRVERANKTLQDRLVKELRECNISSIEEGNAFLESFRLDYNRRFAVAPLSRKSAHRALLPSHKAKHTLLLKEERTLSKDLVFSYKGQSYQVESNNPRRLAGKKIDIYENREGIKLVKQGSEDVKYHKGIFTKRKAPLVVGEKELARLWPRRSYKPKRNHPWR